MPIIFLFDVKADARAAVQNFYRRLGYSPAEAMVREFTGEDIPTVISVPSSDETLQTASLSMGWNGIYLRKAMRLVPIIRFLPGVRAAFICNSVALGTADKDSDIDLLIVADCDRLWVARVFCTLVFHVLGVRRHSTKIAGRLCLSFFVTENALDLQKIAISPRDPYLAFWIASLLPVFGRNQAAEIADKNREFVSKNAGIIIRFQQTLALIPTGNPTIRTIFEYLFGRRTDTFFKKLLLPRAMRKKNALPDTSGTIISETMLKFHNRDRRREFLP